MLPNLQSCCQGHYETQHEQNVNGCMVSRALGLQLMRSRALHPSTICPSAQSNPLFWSPSLPVVNTVPSFYFPSLPAKIGTACWRARGSAAGLGCKVNQQPARRGSRARMEGILTLVEGFKARYFKSGQKSNTSEAFRQGGEDVLAEIKIALLELGDAGGSDAKQRAQALAVSRQVCELATLFSVVTEDDDSFARNFAQAKAYYRDFGSELVESPRKWTILGLYLMYLLATNQLSEFHTELELIPVEDRKQPNIAFPIELEQRLMEGSYRKVLSGRKSVPSVYYKYFMDQLSETVRERISECSMKAYKSIPLNEGKKLFMLDSERELRGFAAARGWKIVDGNIMWNQKAAKSSDLKSKELIEESLGYATELERIV